MRYDLPDLRLVAAIADSGSLTRAAEAARLGVAFLGDLPLDAALREAGDAGRPVVVTSPNGEIAGRFDAVAARVTASLGL